MKAAAGRFAPASPLLRAVLGEALGAAAATDGPYDPCLGRQMVAAGYDRGLARAGGARRPRPRGPRRDRLRVTMTLAGPLNLAGR